MIIAVVLLSLTLVGTVFYYSGKKEQVTKGPVIDYSAAKDTQYKNDYWQAPFFDSIKDSALLTTVEYGAELISHTAKYLGPQGSVLQISNGMNCQNCHLIGGRKIFGNNFGSVWSTYPTFKPRSGKLESSAFRVNDCLKRSLNGKPLDSASKEMQAIIAYFKFLGEGVPKGKRAPGSGLKDISYMDRAADPVKGKAVFTQYCRTCHSGDGQGIKAPGGQEFTTPPLWGAHSYNDGAGLYRLSTFAKYVKYNMPNGTTFEAPMLSDEEAWDVAAYVNSQPRPHYDNKNDWPDISKKPFDHPFGPYKDAFSTGQHKYGPFQPIIAAQKKQSSK